jgi:YD repeat-containing protein
VNADEEFSYDPMGRLNWQSSWTPSSPNQTGIIFQATYDLAGNVTSLSYPDGRVVQQQWSSGGKSAGRLTSVDFASWNGQSVGYNYLSPVTYWPDGAPMSQVYGNGLTASWSRNSRLQPTETFLKNGSTNLLDKQYCYGPAAPISGPNCVLQNVADNGDIFQIQDMLNNNNSQAFTYDTLNRISAFANGGSNMQQTFSIDPLGEHESVRNPQFGPGIRRRDDQP